jgi:hypothetical protein
MLAAVAALAAGDVRAAQQAVLAAQRALDALGTQPPPLRVVAGESGGQGGAP